MTRVWLLENMPLCIPEDFSQIPNLAPHIIIALGAVIVKCRFQMLLQEPIVDGVYGNTRGLLGHVQ